MASGSFGGGCSGEDPTPEHGPHTYMPFMRERYVEGQGDQVDAEEAALEMPGWRHSDRMAWNVLSAQVCSGDGCVQVAGPGPLVGEAGRVGQDEEAVSIPTWLLEIKNSLARATQGEWVAGDHAEAFDVICAVARGKANRVYVNGNRGGTFPFNDAYFIAAIHNAAPRLIRIAERLAEEREAEKAWRDHERKCAVCMTDGLCDKGQSLQETFSAHAIATDDAFNYEQ